MIITKEKFIKSTIILVIGGFITKILGMLIRIIITRVLGLYGTSLYMLVNPTFNLCITIATLSMPVAISKLIAEDNRNNKNLVFSIIPIVMIFNLLIILILSLSSSYIATNLLKNEQLLYPILAIGITLPFISLSSIFRGYFFGKEMMAPHVISNIFEQIIRIISIILLTPYFLKKSIVLAVTSLILFNVISELASILILFIFLPKKFKIKKNYFIPNKTDISDIFAISIPTTLGRLISSIGMFLEPIILTLILLKIGYTKIFITYEYGIICGYVLPMIMMPSFLTSAISNALLPVISKYYQNKKYDLVKRKIKQALLISLTIGIVASLFMFFFPKFCLTLIFNTNRGINYLRIGAILFLISYLLGPISCCLQAMNKAKVVMSSSFIGMIIRIITLGLGLLLDIGVWPLLFSSFFNFLYIFIHQGLSLKKILNH